MDSIARGLLFDGCAAFYAIDGGELVENAKDIQKCSATCAAALGRTLMAASLMGVMLKDDGDVSVIINGGGPAGKIICVGRSDGTVKGCITNPSVELPAQRPGKLDVGGAVGKNGTITVVRDMGLKEPYVGKANLVSGEIAEDVAAYFTYSQQQPSLVYLGVHVGKDFHVKAAGGIIIQPLPGCPDEYITALENKTGEIANLALLLEKGNTLKAALELLLGGMGLEYTGANSPAFVCDCSRKRLEQVLIALGKKELDDMIAKDKGAELTCHFCLKKYNFTEQELISLRDSALKTGGNEK